MKIEFEQGNIVIQAEASSWGPFSFDFANALPTGRTLASVSVKSYLGRVKPDDSDILSTKTETTSELIASSSVTGNTTCAIYFNRPTTAAYINVKHSLVIKFTMDASGGGGTHSAFYYNVEVV